MSAHEEDDFAVTHTPGYKLGQAKTTEEYAQLDAHDESLAKWKASLGVVPGATTAAAGPQVTLVKLELTSGTPPDYHCLTMDLQDEGAVNALKTHPFTIKEASEYRVELTFKVNHGIIAGLRYIQVVKRAGVRLDRNDQMLGSYSFNAEPYTKKFEPEIAPSGMLARGTYNVRSRVTDDDGKVYGEWDWSFKLSKEW